MRAKAAPRGVVLSTDARARVRARPMRRVGGARGGTDGRNDARPPPTIHAAAKVRLCADGGANRLYDELVPMLAAGGGEEARAAAMEDFVPDTIIGDMDSIRDEIKGHYSRRGSRLVDLRHDQDSTDLKKCIRHIIASTGGRPANAPGGAGADDGADDIRIVVIGALGGRLDHELANLSLLYEYHASAASESARGGRLRITIVSDECVAFVLPRGRNTIQLVRHTLRGPRARHRSTTGREASSLTGRRARARATSAVRRTRDTRGRRAG